MSKAKNRKLAEKIAAAGLSATFLATLTSTMGAAPASANTTPPVNNSTWGTSYLEYSYIPGATTTTRVDAPSITWARGAADNGSAVWRCQDGSWGYTCTGDTYVFDAPNGYTHFDSVTATRTVFGIPNVVANATWSGYKRARQYYKLVTTTAPATFDTTPATQGYTNSGIRWEKFNGDLAVQKKIVADAVATVTQTNDGPTAQARLDAAVRELNRLPYSVQPEFGNAFMAAQKHVQNANYSNSRMGMQDQGLYWRNAANAAKNIATDPAVPLDVAKAKAAEARAASNAVGAVFSKFARAYGFGAWDTVFRNLSAFLTQAQTAATASEKFVNSRAGDAAKVAKAKSFRDAALAAKNVIDPVAARTAANSARDAIVGIVGTAEKTEGQSYADEAKRLADETQATFDKDAAADDASLAKAKELMNIALDALAASQAPGASMATIQKAAVDAQAAADVALVEARNIKNGAKLTDALGYANRALLAAYDIGVASDNATLAFVKDQRDVAVKARDAALAAGTAVDAADKAAADARAAANLAKVEAAKITYPAKAAEAQGYVDEALAAADAADRVAADNNALAATKKHRDAAIVARNAAIIIDASATDTAKAATDAQMNADAAKAEVAKIADEAKKAEAKVAADEAQAAADEAAKAASDSALLAEAKINRDAAERAKDEALTPGATAAETRKAANDAQGAADAAKATVTKIGNAVKRAAAQLHADEAQRFADEARDAADAVALAKIEDLRDEAEVAAVTASDAAFYSTAQLKAQEAARAAADARLLADSIGAGRPLKDAAEVAASLAEGYASEAARDARDARLVEFDIADAREEALDAQNKAIELAKTNAPAAYAEAVAAREAAAVAEAVAADVAERTAAEGGGTVDPRERDAAAAIAAEARAAANAAMEATMAPQSMLDTQNAIVAEPSVESATGKAFFTFAKNAQDTTNAVGYRVSAERSGQTVFADLAYGPAGSAIVSGDNSIVLTDNGDGTVTATFGNLPGSERDAVKFRIEQKSWERSSATPTLIAPSAPSASMLSSLLVMEKMTDNNEICESVNAPGILENGECVTKSDLKFDTRAYEYPTTPLTGRNWVSSGYNETYQSGTESYIATYNIVYGTRPVYSTRRVSKMCQSGMMVYDCSYNETYQSGTETYDTGQRTPVYATRPTYATRWVDTSHWVCDAAPSGWYTVGDCANGYYKRSTPFGVDEDAYEKGPNLRGARAVVDGSFSDTTWRDGGSSYVANKPRPASEIDRPGDGIHYKYEADSNMYVARTVPDVYSTWKPVFTSLPSSVTGWTVGGQTHRGLEGHDTGRRSQDIVVHTLGGDVTIRGQVDESTRRPAN